MLSLCYRLLSPYDGGRAAVFALADKDGAVQSGGMILVTDGPAPASFVPARSVDEFTYRCKNL